MILYVYSDAQPIQLQSSKVKIRISIYLTGDFDSAYFGRHLGKSLNIT